MLGVCGFTMYSPFSDGWLLSLQISLSLKMDLFSNRPSCVSKCCRIFYIASAIGEKEKKNTGTHRPTKVTNVIIRSCQG